MILTRYLNSSFMAQQKGRSFKQNDMAKAPCHLAGMPCFHADVLSCHFPEMMCFSTAYLQRRHDKTVSMEMHSPKKYYRNRNGFSHEQDFHRIFTRCFAKFVGPVFGCGFHENHPI